MLVAEELAAILQQHDLSKDDLYEALKALDPTWTDSTLDDVLQTVGVVDGGRVEIERFIAWVTGNQQQQTLQAVDEPKMLLPADADLMASIRLASSQGPSTLDLQMTAEPGPLSEAELLQAQLAYETETQPPTRRPSTAPTELLEPAFEVDTDIMNTIRFASSQGSRTLDLTLTTAEMTEAEVLEAQLAPEPETQPPTRRPSSAPTEILDPVLEGGFTAVGEEELMASIRIATSRTASDSKQRTPGEVLTASEALLAALQAD
eukprot:TRINITY_DN10800_c0_g1_i1.p1 TRINITY_DN10800_c0_g1~~TRINITY_DN10800_c0_g1_i1.p1  ORF type:complete len:262 (-),score=66.25 TRINITY_DN10800_c0_g1_i1:309-1094(-)